MNNMIQYAYFSIIGKVRSNLEDNLYINRSILPVKSTGTNDVISGHMTGTSFPLIGVFDGMGGESFGETAAFIAADTMRKKDTERTGQIRNQEFLKELCHDMNQEVNRYAKNQKIRSMGTTAVCIMFADREVHFANVGDSRIYRTDSNGITRITKDQVMKSIFFAKPPLAQYLGMEEEDMVLLPQTGTLPINPDNLFLLCTDGVTDMLSDNEISEIIRSCEKTDLCIEKLKQAVLAAGAKDNATAVLCGIEQ